MADDASHGASSSTVKPADDPESTIEINIKTLDSQVHKLRVEKNAPVSVLKEKVVEATGVPLDQQRLIFRGRVLKDDHLLSEYHLEDGYTLHLVARRAAEGQNSSGAPEGNTHANVNVTGNEGLLDDISRSVRDLLGSLGVAMSGGVTNTAFSVPLTTAPEGPNNVPGRTQPMNPAQPGFSVLNHQIQVTQLQPPGAIPRNMIIPDSLTTLSEYMDRIDQVLQNNGAPPSRDSESQQQPTVDDANVNPRYPSPDVLASVIERAQQLLGGSAASALSHIAQRIRQDGETADASLRREIQTESVQLGISMQHLGAMFFELGRTMMMLRTGRSPSEAFVNSGPAVYINSTGPNPIMVQPSYQNTPPFGVSNIPVMGGISGAFGIVDPSRSSGFGDPFRRMNVPSTGASATSGSAAGTTTTSEGAINGNRQDAARTQGGNPPGHPAATRGLPTRTVVAAVPARSSVEAPNHVFSVILPVQVRGQVAVPTQSSQGSQTAVGNGAQGNSTSAVPQASVGGVSGVPPIVAQVANALATNAPSQVSLSTETAADQGFHPTTDSRAVLNSSTPATTSLQNDPSDTADLSGDSTATNTHDVPSNTSIENSALKNKSSDEVGSQLTEPSASGSAEPLGLGGGLIPKKRSRAVKPSGSTTDPGRDSSSVSQNQDPISVAQQFLEGFASRNTNASRSNAPASGPPSSVPQPTEVPLRRQGGGQPDIGSMISGMLNNPVFSNILSNVATQAGGSSADLRGVMEGLQSPAVVDTISSIVQNVDEQDLGAMFGSGRGQGGLDLSRMLQQMMPVVSQALGGAGGRSAGANSRQSRSWPQRIDSGGGNVPASSSSQIDLHQARESIEQHESPENIFSSVLETAAQAYGEDDSIQGMIEELASDQELTDEYLKFLVEQVRQRVQSESQSTSQP
ncbi:large proline-rich protein BAG6 isoform X2 [Sorghum bicolor]|uniref:Ubiquitin-like domain-containing protein n=1 Tax=Sorghum bicolor TaxID=4558 RepID=A0A1B6PIL9_SORBI|nr:large proline-rich protein BAG6 isoform X2 [Sorghum bicolor]KXG25467.1 hypothetical protein SORBI_3007G183900 [Sorghum bicolor]|eukprot:XP_021320506.1 large proline-rich protein BAG6 isoform X2 [Sorghum bicolor]